MLPLDIVYGFVRFDWYHSAGERRVAVELILSARVCRHKCIVTENFSHENGRLKLVVTVFVVQ